MAWSEVLFGSIPDELKEIAKTQKYDHTYLCYPDTTWQSDSHRNVSERSSEQEFRINMFNRMEELLKLYNRPYSVIKGNDKEYVISSDINEKYLK